MHVTGISYWAVAVAAVAGFVFSGIWYGVFSKQWLAASGMDEKLAHGGGGNFSAKPFIVTFIAQFVMAWILAGILLHVLRGGIALSLRNALISAVLIWIGFVMTTLVVNHTFQGIKRTQTLIDGGHWLGVLLIQSALLSWLAGA